jgi:hypothetical protein
MVLALDGSGNVLTSEEQPVLLVASGSARGGGPITMRHGIGSITLQDSLPELVALSLVDISSTGIDASATEVLQFVPGCRIDLCLTHFRSDGISYDTKHQHCICGYSGNCNCYCT